MLFDRSSDLLSRARRLLWTSNTAIGTVLEALLQESHTVWTRNASVRIDQRAAEYQPAIALSNKCGTGVSYSLRLCAKKNRRDAEMAWNSILVSTEPVLFKGLVQVQHGASDLRWDDDVVVELPAATLFHEFWSMDVATDVLHSRRDCFAHRSDCLCTFCSLEGLHRWASEF